MKHANSFYGIKQFYECIIKTLSDTTIHNIWIVTVICTNGSTPGKLGMKMLVKDNTECIGTIGGGSIEKLVIDKIMTKQITTSMILSFNLGNDSSISNKNYHVENTGMICGGQQTVFIESLTIKHYDY